MIEKLLVGTFVLIASLYAFRSLAPSRWLSDRTGGLADRIEKAGFPAWARFVRAYAPAGGGACGAGCSSCEAAPAVEVGASSAGVTPAAKPAERVDQPLDRTEKTMRFVRKGVHGSVRPVAIDRRHTDA